MSYLSNAIKQNVADPVWREQQRAANLKRDARRIHERALVAPTTLPPGVSPFPVYYEMGDSDLSSTDPDPTLTSLLTSPDTPIDTECRIEDALRLWDKFRAEEPGTLRLVHERRIAKLTGLSVSRMAALIAEQRPYVASRPTAYRAADEHRRLILAEYNRLCIEEATTPYPVLRRRICDKYGVSINKFSLWMHRIKTGKWDREGQPIGDKPC